ncbi:MAG TPA: phosphonate C-P lyase system protein PhnH [Acidisphaera sp.]|nr:phosphonate C-P lyase system protein PhnH [Acidisphaera sp.]
MTTADPVLDAQATFRAVLGAMARPGRIHALPPPPAPAPDLMPATASLLAALADADTPVWLDLDLHRAAEWIAFHCGAPAAPIDTAAFVVSGTLPDLRTPRAGTDEQPELGATVIVQVAGLGTGQRYRLSGPGVDGVATLAIDGVRGLATAWAANRARFPLGVDLVFCAGLRVAALPRSVTVEDA